MQDIKQTIRRLEDTLRVATLENDVHTTNELLTDDWLNINATGSITNKAQSLDIMPNFHFLSIVNMM